jgi:hypothetical protein
MAAPRSCTASTLGPVDRQTSILNLPREVKDPIFRLESPVLSSVGREFVQHEGKAIGCVGAKPDLGAAGAGPPCGPPNPEARASPAGNPLSHSMRQANRSGRTSLCICDKHARTIPAVKAQALPEPEVWRRTVHNPGDRGRTGVDRCFTRTGARPRSFDLPSWPAQ